MASYNHILNPSRKYRTLLIEALVENTELPSYESLKPQTKQHKGVDALLDVLVSRDFADVGSIMELQFKKFGPINEDLFWAAHSYVESHRHRIDPTKEHQHTMTVPTDELFESWKKLHTEYFRELLNYTHSIVKEGVHEFSREEICQIFQKVLVHEGLDTLGWEVLTNSKTNLVAISKIRKRIFVGPKSIRFSHGRLVGLVVHEIGIHVRWAENHGPRRRVASEEGVGTLVEQLTIDVFQPLRLHRFLAICFAAGVDGTPRDMRQVFDKVLDVRRQLHPEEDELIARQFVAKEVVRVFRNLPHDIPGLVYIRDKQYFEHNIAIWNELTKTEPTMSHFMKLVAPWSVSS